MVFATIKKIKNIFMLIKSKHELSTHGVKYRVVYSPRPQDRLFEFSLKKGKYTLKVSPFLYGVYFNVFVVSNNKPYNEIILRKNQIIFIAKDKFVIRQLLSGVTTIGFFSELKMRKKLSSRGCNIPPKLHYFNLVERYLIEEFIVGKPISSYYSNKQIASLDVIVSSYDNIVRFGKRKQTPLSSIHGKYCKKLDQIKLKLNNERAINFIESYISELDDLTLINNKCYIEIIDVMHGDFNLSKNIILSKSGNIRIIDWEHASSGPSFFDLFYAIVHLKINELEKIELIKRAAHLKSIPNISDSCVISNIYLCFTLLVIIKLNVCLYKDGFNEKSLNRRVEMLSDTHQLLEAM